MNYSLSCDEKRPEMGIEIVRKNLLAEKIVIVDGAPGCGKTMMSPIISSLDRVELLSYAFEIEHICRLYSLGKMAGDAATAMIRILADHKLYQTMMGREVNFRYSDLSSAFKNSSPWRYFKRIFQEGDMVIPQRIKEEKPILNLTTHNILSYSEPIISGLGRNVVLVEVVRHPLFMVKQHYLNMVRLMDSPRDISVYIEFRGGQLPYYACGWEEIFFNANEMERAVLSLQEMAKTSEVKRKLWMEDKELSLITVPFEKFVLNPYPYLENIAELLGTRMVKKTYKEMRRQKVPRKQQSDGPPSEIYKRCGWVPPSFASEQKELDLRRDLVAEHASVEVLAVMDKLSESYVQTFLSE